MRDYTVHYISRDPSLGLTGLTNLDLDAPLIRATFDLAQDAINHPMHPACYVHPGEGIIAVALDLVEEGGDLLNMVWRCGGVGSPEDGQITRKKLRTLMNRAGMDFRPRGLNDLATQLGPVCQGLVHMAGMLEYLKEMNDPRVPVAYPIVVPQLNYRLMHPIRTATPTLAPMSDPGGAWGLGSNRVWGHTIPADCDDEGGVQ